MITNKLLLAFTALLFLHGATAAIINNPSFEDDCSSWAFRYLSTSFLSQADRQTLTIVTEDLNTEFAYDYMDKRYESWGRAKEAPNFPFRPTDGGKHVVKTQTGPGRTEMSQDIYLPPSAVTLSFDVKYRNYASVMDQQQNNGVRLVDINSNAELKLLWDTRTSRVFQTPGWSTISVDISAFSGQTVRLQIFAVDNYNYFWASWDNLRVLNANGININEVSCDDGQKNGNEVLVDCGGGTCDSCTEKISLSNDGPMTEGGATEISITVDPEYESSNPELRFVFSCDGDNLDTITYAQAGSSKTTTCTFPDNGVYTVTAVAVDNQEGKLPLSTSVTVTNACPILAAAAASTYLVSLGSSIALTASFSDAGVLDTHSGSWSCSPGSLSTEAGVLDTADINKKSVFNMLASSFFPSAGVYTCTLEIMDNVGCTDTVEIPAIIVYDASAGFVTGGGWIDSPAGAMPSMPEVTGRANFGFVSKHKKGQSTPDGKTEFNFRAGYLNFQSSSYEWLVIVSFKAMYKGSGTINGQGNYGFLLTAIDGDLQQDSSKDKFRIKIWDRSNNDVVVYDNEISAGDNAAPTTSLGGGSIKIHSGSGPSKSNSAFTETAGEVEGVETSPEASNDSLSTMSATLSTVALSAVGVLFIMGAAFVWHYSKALRRLEAICYDSYPIRADGLHGEVMLKMEPVREQA